MASINKPTPATALPKAKDNSTADTLEHFSHLPLAQSILQNPRFKIHPLARPVPQIPGQHTLMTQTWNTPDTISHMLTFTNHSSLSSSSSSSSSPSSSTPPEPAEALQFIRLFTFGTGLNAHTNRLHGGVIATLLDNTLGNCAHLALQMVSKDEAVTVVTVQMNIGYQKPVVTPGSLMIVARVKRVENGGRKIWVEGVVQGGDGEDGEVGEVCHATAEGMFLRVKKPGGKL